MECYVLNPPPPDSYKTEIYFGLNHLVQTCENPSKMGAIVVDEKIAEFHGAAIQKMLGYELIAIPNQKTREAKQALEDELFKKNLGRDAFLIGVGGGALTDLVGFTASTYMRGVPLILIPSTLLGMVDAAIGGKTGIDTPFGKNSIGSFYLPKAIFIDLDLLKTLPEIEMKNGLSEILKVGLVANRTIWEKGAQWEQELPYLIRASIKEKVRVVETDFEEKKGLRRILNFGHTVGHALELLSNYQMAHGEAVALGCMAEGYLSHRLGYLSKRDFETILSLYQNLGYAFKKVDPKAFVDAMNRDKKAKGKEARFVLIDQIGHALPFDGEYCTSVPQENIDQMIKWMHDG